MIAIIVIIKKAMITCIAYCIKAMMLPTWIIPLSTCPAPTHKISSVVPFIKNIINGINKAMARVVNKLTLVISRLAFSNFSCSTVSLLKARITKIPSKSSCTTLLSLSVNFCIFLNLGITTANILATMLKITTTQSAMIHVIPASLCKT